MSPSTIATIANHMARRRKGGLSSAAGLADWRQAPGYRLNSSRARSSRGKSPDDALVPRVADQRFFLAAKQDKDCRHNADNRPGREVEGFLQIRVPGPRGLVFEPILHRVEAVLIDDRPAIYDLGIDEIVIGDGFGPIIDQEHKGHRQQAQAEKAKQKSDH